MKKVFKAAQLGSGQLGKPWFDYISSLENWNIKLYESTKSIDFSETDVLFLAVKDESLFEIIESLNEKDLLVCHFSGFHYFKKAIGLHPVYSFSKKKELVDFKSLNWVLDSADCPNHIKDLLGESVSYIAPENKKLYHSLLSVSANMSQLISHLLGEAFKQETGLSPDFLKLLMIQSIENESKYGKESFSGPWIRNEKQKQDEFIEKLNNKILKTSNKNFKNMIEVYNEHYRL